MTIIADHIAGFEESTALAQIDQSWRRFDTDATVLKGSGHALVAATDYGTALSLPSGAGIMRKTITSDAARPYILIAVNKTSAGSRKILVANYSGLGIGMFVTWKADGTFEIFDRSGVSKGVTNTAYASLNTRYYLQVSWSASSSSENLKIYVDGVLDKTFTGDWRGGGINTAGLTEYDICYDGTSATTGADVRIDDCYFLHDSNTPALVFPNLKVETLVPNADGITLELTPSTGTSHFAVVDETPPDTADYLQSLSVAGTSTRLDLFDYPAPSSDAPSSKNVYAVGAYAYARGSTVADDRLQLRTNFSGNIPETQNVANFTGNASLQNSTDFLYSCPVAMPISSLSSGGGGVTISSFDTNYTFGPRVVRGGTVTNSSKVYTWAISVAKGYFVPSGVDWFMGRLGMGV